VPYLVLKIRVTQGVRSSRRCHPTNDSIVRYETQIKTGKFLIVAYGDAVLVATAYAIPSDGE